MSIGWGVCGLVRRLSGRGGEVVEVEVWIDLGREREGGFVVLW